MSTKKSFAGFEQKIAVVKGDMKLSKSGDAILLTKLESSSSRLQHFCLQKRRSNTSIHRRAWRVWIKLLLGIGRKR
jgi:hypothetical protein